MADDDALFKRHADPARVLPEYVDASNGQD
jgi:hypothetical protein